MTDMTDEVELVDLLEYYQPVSTSEIQTIITAKEEFSELSSEIAEKLPPGKGKYFKHQKYVHRYMRLADKFFDISEPGTGKSCSILGFTEYCLKENTKYLEDPSSADTKVAHLSRVIILVRSDGLIREMMKQLICKCSDGHFMTENILEADTEQGQANRLTRTVRNYGYTIMTYGTFISSLVKKYPSIINDQVTDDDYQKILNDYSNIILWIDEGHNLISESKNPSSEDIIDGDKAKVYRGLWNLMHIIKNSKKIISTATPMINNPNGVKYLLNLLLPEDGDMPENYDYKNAEPHEIRILFPDYQGDYTHESREHMKKYYKGQIPSSTDLSKITLEELEVYIRGMFGYIRAADTGAIPVYKESEITSEIYQLTRPLYVTVMEKFQSDAYYRLKTESKSSSLSVVDRQSEIFIFPDGNVGGGVSEVEKAARRQKIKDRKVRRKGERETTTEQKTKQVENKTEREKALERIEAEEMEQIRLDDAIDRSKLKAFSRYVIYNKNKDTFKATPEFIEYLTTDHDNIGGEQYDIIMNNIKHLSSKFAAIINLIDKNISNGDGGVIFIYGEYVEASLIPFAICLEVLGYSRFNEKNSIFESVVQNAVTPFCTNDIGDKRIKSQFKKEWRYGIYTGNLSGSKLNNMMDAVNNSHNKDGEYIKIFISSRSGREGINVNNVKQIHLFGPEWNESNMYQTMYRGIRATSHEDLLNDIKQQYIMKGLDPDNATLDIEIYMHAAIPIDEDGYYDNNATDFKMYATSEDKDRSIRRVMRMFKQAAIGCWTHYDRNVRSTDVDYSSRCDYDVCHYQCVNKYPEYTDYSTFNVKYVSERINETINEIKNLYLSYNTLTLDDILDHLNNDRISPVVIIMALEHIITNRVPINNRFGYINYLKEDGNRYYLDYNYSNNNTSSLSSYYTNGINIINTKSLADIVTIQEFSNYDKIYNKWLRMYQSEEDYDVVDAKIIRELSEFTISTQASILEDVIIKNILYDESLPEDEKHLNLLIYDSYALMNFSMNYPATEIQKHKQDLVDKKLSNRPGPKPKIKDSGYPSPLGYGRILNIINKNLYTFETDTEIVYLHTLHSINNTDKKSGNAANLRNASGKIRILYHDRIGNGWSDVSPEEYIVYNTAIQIINEFKEREIMTRTKVFGKLILGTFNIVDNRDVTGVVTDARKKRPGLRCKDFKPYTLVDILYHLDYPVEITDEHINNISQRKRIEMINLIKKKIPSKFKEEDVNDVHSWDIEKIIYYYFFLSSSSYNRDVLCGFLKEIMIVKDFILK